MLYPKARVPFGVSLGIKLFCLSALFNKLILTFRTGDADFPLALWHSHLLLTGRTFIKMINLALFEMLLFAIPLYG